MLGCVHREACTQGCCCTHCLSVCRSISTAACQPACLQATTTWLPARRHFPPPSSYLPRTAPTRHPPPALPAARPDQARNHPPSRARLLSASHATRTQRAAMPALLSLWLATACLLLAASAFPVPVDKLLKSAAKLPATAFANDRTNLKFSAFDKTFSFKNTPFVPHMTNAQFGTAATSFGAMADLGLSFYIGSDDSQPGRKGVFQVDRSGKVHGYVFDDSNAGYELYTDAADQTFRTPRVCLPSAVASG
eukprot:m.19406 g.19406  ORF g.19406 m.19406 type:complete len:250 (-) comp31008_c0_seq1:87-836(-)